MSDFDEEVYGTSIVAVGSRNEQRHRDCCRAHWGVSPGRGLLCLKRVTSIRRFLRTRHTKNLKYLPGKSLIL
jgi:hypothetical protein